MQVFQKGSPILDDVSKAILKISQNGVLKELEDKWFPISSECSTSSDNHHVKRLNPKDFFALYLIYGSISVICFLCSIVTMIRRYQATNNAIASRDWCFVHRLFNISMVEIIDVHKYRLLLLQLR